MLHRVTIDVANRTHPEAIGRVNESPFPLLPHYITILCNTFFIVNLNKFEIEVIESDLGAIKNLFIRLMP